MFIEYGLNIQNPIPVQELFDRLAVAKTEKAAALRRTNPRLYHDHESDHDKAPGYSRTASHTYQAIGQMEQEKPALHAQQIMTSPVTCLNIEMTIAETLNLFRQYKYRHMPVTTDKGRLTGMVSDRDILHYTSGLSGSYEMQTGHDTADPVSKIMSSPVLTANTETDVRYIARLFVGQHIGAMPIMSNGQLAGIISRTDIMRAVMQNFVLELWT